jgi:glycosyltransferase involved in cell wall biosynthesis
VIKQIPIEVGAKYELPLVSVLLVTYNQEPYIRRAIEGVLTQITDFPIELVIGEDASIDNTRQICEEYAAEFPEKIRLLPKRDNLGLNKKVPANIRSV